ncbi:lamin tail domain-containing protein [Rhodococcus aerolatus]
MAPSPRRLLAGLAGLAVVASTGLVLGAAPALAATGTVVINEVESSGGTPGDWVELLNTGGAPVDISGYVVTDNAPTDPTHQYRVPAGTVLATGSFFVVDTDTTAPGFGLGSADSANLFLPDAQTLLDTYSWTAHATTTYGRCPDGTGAFTTTAASTKGGPNACGTTPAPTPADPWPGGQAVSTADVANQLGGNVSGLAYEKGTAGAPDVLWAVQNGPSTLFRLLFNGATWTPDTANGWAAGKVLNYPDGTGDPDAEGVTLVNGSSATGVYVSTERNNEANTVSRPEVLRFDVSGTTTALSATTEFNLTPDLPVVGPNLGLEAVTWVPDTALVAKGLRDATTGAPYTPATYPGHGDGLFFTGLEADGIVRAYALDTNGSYTRVATFPSGFPGVMDLEWEPETSLLWAACDDTCAGRTTTLDVGSTGSFGVAATYERPTGMPNLNNEGFAIAPQSSCVAGVKPVFWSDDSNTDGHALRTGTLRCTPLDTSAPTNLITTVDAPRTVTPSAEYTATVTVRNTGSTPAGRTTVTALTIGAGTVISAPGGDVTGPLVTFTTPGVAAGDSVVRPVVLRAPAGPSFGVTGAVAGSVTPDPRLLDNLALAPVITR